MNASSPVVFNPTPLTDVVDKAQLRAWRRARKAAQGSASASSVMSNVVLVPIVIVCGLIFLWLFVGIGQLAWRAITGDSGGGSAPFALPLTMVAVVIIALLVVAALRRHQVRGYRLERFARANQMKYLPSVNAPNLPGMIFSQGNVRVASDLVRGDRPRFVEFANYNYTTGSGKNKTTHRWGYVAIKLDVPLPNIVLDAKGNNSIFGSNLPVTLDKQQRLSLEGNFDEFFSLYCPRGYERDALYLFTPDIMARFIDHAAALDVEIVDNWLFLYARRDFVTLDPATWAWLFATVQALLDKLAQWARWRDDRLLTDAAAPALGAGAAIPGLAAAADAAASAVPFAGAAPRTPPPGVAASGRRLKRSVSWPTIIIMGVVILGWMLMQSGVIGALFSGFSR